MNMAHVHLLLNHVPVIGMVVAVGLLSYALLRRSDELTRTSLGMIVVLAVMGVAVYLTGEPAEELVAAISGITEASIERHEEAALVATLLLAGAGLVAGISLVALRKDPARLVGRFGRAMLLVALVPTAAMAYTAYLGGRIRHAEIRSPGVPAPEAVSDWYEGR